MSKGIAILSTHSGIAYAKRIYDALKLVVEHKQREAEQYGAPPIFPFHYIEPGFKRFSDGEMHHRRAETINERDVYIIAPLRTPQTYPDRRDHGLHDNLMDLYFLIRHALDGSAGKIRVIVPYFPYARSDRKDRSRASIKAADLVSLLRGAFEGKEGRIITSELHSPTIQGIFGPVVR